MTDLNQMIGRIDERTENMAQSMSELKEFIKSHDQRINSLEADRNRVKGTILGLSLGSGAVGAFLTKWLNIGGH